MISAILVGAGKGERLSSSVPKAFIRIGGKEIFYYSLVKFYRKVDEIILVFPQDYLEKWKEKLEKEFQGIKVISGGKERYNSVKNGLDILENQNGIVLIHDVARPFFSENLIKRVIEGAEKYGACVPSVEVKDTLKQIDGDFVVKTLDREKIFAVQTPQGFKVEIIKKAYREAERKNVFGSDDAILVERMGIKVYSVDGEQENIKITYPVDLKIAEIMVEKWEQVE